MTAGAVAVAYLNNVHVKYDIVEVEMLSANVGYDLLSNSDRMVLISCIECDCDM